MMRREHEEKRLEQGQERLFFMRQTAFFCVSGLIQATIASSLLGVWGVLSIPSGLLGSLCLVLISINYGTAIATLWVARTYPDPVLGKPIRDASDGSRITAVVVPCLLSSENTIDELLDVLQRNQCASIGVNAIFILLADYVDAFEITDAVVERDLRLLEYVRQGIRRLNAASNGDFGLLVRDRIWAPTEMMWMGEERKRGKLEAFNRYLLDSIDCDFSVIECGEGRLDAVKYVLTLDADTILPKNTLSDLAALLDQHREYSMIQPGYRAVASEPKNWYQWIHSSPFPPLTVLQGVFGRCKFVGKGIYRVREFHNATVNRVPQGWVLSHDVLEGCLVKVGGTDEVFVEEASPETFEEGCARLQRWYRGDWQNLPWALPSWLRYLIPEFSGLRREKLGVGGAWTVADLIVRDLHAPALLILLLMGVFSRFSLSVTVGLFGCEVIWATVTYLAKRLRNEADSSWRNVLRVPLGSGFYFMSLPTQAWIAMDACCRAAWRMFVSKRQRLQWTASAEFRSSLASQGRFWTVIPAVSFGLPVSLVAYVVGSPGAALMAVGWLSFPAVVTLLERRVIAAASRF